MRGETLNRLKTNTEVIKDAVWALIPARGGSKSIPLKNMVDLNGRPLIDYTIRAAKACRFISRIICSTENRQIAEYCLHHTIEVQERPLNLAEDNSTTLDVILYVLETIKEIETYLPEYLVLLEPTSPFVLPEHIKDCVDLIRSDSKADSSQTVTPVEPNSHAYNQRYLDENGSHFIFLKEREQWYNKQLKPQFYIHGNVRAMRVKSVLKKKNIFGDRSLPLIIPSIYCIDVDGKSQLELARCIIKCGLIELPE